MHIYTPIDTRIQNITAKQIIDSRGNPTISCTVFLECGARGTAQIPSGASKGKYEAVELRDGGRSYSGKSVQKCIQLIEKHLRGILLGKVALNQQQIDRMLCEEDGTSTKERFGANTLLAISLATAKAVSTAYHIPLYRYLGGIQGTTLPCPMLNILNGGKHAENNLDIQEFMILPRGASSFDEAMQMSCEIYAALKHILTEDDLSTAVGDEGGFAPDLRNDEEALIYLTRAIEFAGYQPGRDVFLALDAAASEWKTSGGYHLPKRDIFFTREQLTEYFLNLCEKYCILSLEDPLAEDDFLGFSELTKKAGTLQIVGDDLFVTQKSRLETGVREKAGNAILIKPNQVGTLSETMETISFAKQNGFTTVISHRSGETNDSFISDLAVAVNSPFIKAGAPSRGERLSKYNRLLEIEADNPNLSFQ